MGRIFYFTWLSILAGCIATGFSAQSIAQRASISGVILDAESGETIPLVNIVKEGTTIGTNSDENGLFELELGPGIHTLQFSSMIYVDTLIQVRLAPLEQKNLTLQLQEDRLVLGEIVVSADRVTRMVQQLAVFREQQNEGLTSYRADVYKLAILGTQDSEIDSVAPIAFSERVSEIKHVISPERFSETTVANRSSKNFFSEYDFFSTGGPPLNLNQELVPLSILSEDITVIGPISKRAGRFYYLSDQTADSTWPSGTIEISFTPKNNNRPLFEGSVWVQQSTNSILGIDVRLNDYASTNTGLFSIQNLRYKQSYMKVGDFWLPENTKLSATLDFLASAKPIQYLDEWAWSGHEVNPKLSLGALDLNTSVMVAGSHRKSGTYWDSVSTAAANDNLSYLDKAKTYTEKNRTLRLGMSVMSNFFRLPYELERFYLTNISDIYRFNRVEGHTLGLGIRTPVHPNYQYRAVTAYSFGQKDWTYTLSGLQFIPGTAFAPEIIVQKDVVQQYQDYEYNRTPLDFFEFRHTLAQLLDSEPVNNYFLRKGIASGFRYRFDIESFFRVLYLNESHSALLTTTNKNLLGQSELMGSIPNNDPIYPMQNGSLTGVSFHLHHDTRKYLRTQFLRDYNIRDFGWLGDVVWEMGTSNWGGDFDFHRYRLGLKFNIPVFSSHFIQTDIIAGASSDGTPSQRLFTYNGFVLDDYVRERPFNTVSFREPIGHRVSVLRLKYKFGSSLTRKSPLPLLQKSGIHLATFLTVGTIDDKASLEPLLPYSNSKTQAEIGIAAFKIFGFLYAEFSQRIAGDYGNSVGFQILF
ncbi:MAG: carboxypeptidase-like regulatory domain-containing protein [Balneolaceae bacterium]|nr:carboxypeptidase-like regulatory domain-containing protein [Balneolaceae bacterium]